MVEWKEADIMLSSKRTTPINAGGSSSQGSIVLEAALVMPVFIIVMFFFIYMVQMTLYSVQMNTLASSAVKQVSAHIYPVSLAVEQHSQQGSVSSDSGRESAFEWTMPKLSLADWAGQYTEGLPEPLAQWITDAVAKGEEPLHDLKNSAVEAVLDPVVKPLLRPFLQDTMLNEERLHVSGIIVPNLKTGKNPYFALEISYELPVKVPFSNRRVVLQAKAQERLWIGDTGELNDNADSEEQTEGQAPIILSKPEPAYAGSRTRITARIPEGTVANLTVYYKSGVSQAKFLGEASVNDDGIVEWQWLVGGNTTPGTWTFVVETPDGLRTTGEFVVESPSKK